MMVAFIMRERHTDVVTRLLDRWNEEGVTLHSPPLARNAGGRGYRVKLID